MDRARTRRSPRSAPTCAGAPTSTACGRTSASATSVHGRGVGRRTPSAGGSRRAPGALTADVLIVGNGAAQRAGDPRHPRPRRRSRARSFHSAPGTTTTTSRGKRVAVIGTGASAIQFVPADPAAGRRQLHALPAHAAVDPAAPRPADHPRRAGALPPLSRRAQRAIRAGDLLGARAAACSASRTPAAHARRRARSPARHLAARSTDPELRAQADARLPSAASASCSPTTTTRRSTEPNVDVVTDADRPGRAATRRRHRRRHASTRSTRSSSAPASTSTDMPVADRRARPRRPHAGRGLGGQRRRPTSARRSPASRTCSCSLGPNTGLGHTSIVYMIEAQVDYMLDALAQLDARRRRAASRSAPEAQTAFNERGPAPHAAAPSGTPAAAQLVPRRHGRNTTLWPDFTFRFRAPRSRGRADEHNSATRARPPPGAEPVLGSRRRYDVEGAPSSSPAPPAGSARRAARRLHAKGANVALVGLEPDLLEALAAELGDRAAWFEADVTDAAALDRAVAGDRRALRRHRRRDRQRRHPDERLAAHAPLENLERVIEVNLLGVWRTDRAVLPRSSSARATCSTSRRSPRLVARPADGPVHRVEGGGRGDDRRAAVEVAPTGARVGCAYFGFIDTDIVRDRFAEPSAKAISSRCRRSCGGPRRSIARSTRSRRAIERRAARVWAPRFVGPALALRGLLQPLADRRSARSARCPRRSGSPP